MATQQRDGVLASLGAPSDAELAEIRTFTDAELRDAVRTRPALYANACLDELAARTHVDPDPYRHAYDDARAGFATAAALLVVAAAVAVALVAG